MTRWAIDQSEWLSLRNARAAASQPVPGGRSIVGRTQASQALAPFPEARMILTVHDELVFEVPQARAEEIAEVVREAMQSAATLKVPLTVDVGIGENWKDAKHS